MQILKNVMSSPICNGVNRAGKIKQLSAWWNQSVCHDLEPAIFPFSPLTWSLSTMYIQASDQKVNTTKRKQFNTPPCYQQVAKSLEQCPEILLSSCHLSPYLHLLELHLDWKKCHFQKIHLMRSWMIALCFLLSCFYNPLLVQGCMT